LIALNYSAGVLFQNMPFKPALAFASSLLLLSCQAAKVIPYEQLGALEDRQTVRVFYPSAGGNIEAYITRPQGEGPFPLVVLLHGHSFIGRGADQVLATAQTFAREICFATVAISLPGYGASEVAPGAVVETTRQVVKDGIAFAQQLDWVDQRQTFFYGVSRGAIVAAAMLNDIEGLSGAVLYSGAYDLGRLYRDTPSFWVRRILNPDGDADPKLFNLLADGAKWTVPTLILHGEKDQVIPVNQAKLLRDRLKIAGVYHQLVVYPDHGHFLPRTNVRERSMNFFRQFSAPACPVSNHLL
jgi:dipeptidyl aminopeptidase/acylaminoacyl peptidase